MAQAADGPRGRRELHRISGTQEARTQPAARAGGPSVLSAHGHRPRLWRDGALLERAHRHDQDPYVLASYPASCILYPVGAPDADARCSPLICRAAEGDRRAGHHSVAADRRDRGRDVARRGLPLVLQGHHAACAPRRARAGDRVRGVRARAEDYGDDEGVVGGQGIQRVTLSSTILFIGRSGYVVGSIATIH